jgi:hypothetical protein
VGGAQRADVLYSQQRVFGERVGGPLPTNESNPLPKLDQVLELRNDLPGQARPQPGINSGGINFPTPPKQFNPITGELGSTPGSDLPISA